MVSKLEYPTRVYNFEIWASYLILHLESIAEATSEKKLNVKKMVQTSREIKEMKNKIAL